MILIFWFLIFDSFINIDVISSIAFISFSFCRSFFLISIFVLGSYGG